MTWARAEGVLWRHTLDGMVLLSLKGEEAVFLTGPAVMLWSMLVDGPLDRQEVCATLAGAYGADLASIEGDVDGVVAALTDRHVLVQSG